MTSQREKIQPKLSNKVKNSPSSISRHSFQSQSKSPLIIKKELTRIIPQLNKEQQENLSLQLLKELEKKGIDRNELKKTLSLSTLNPKQLNPKEISEIATYTYQHYPDVFQTLLTQPNLVKFLSNPILSAIVGIMAARWLNH